jgi:hypothetical protein
VCIVLHINNSKLLLMECMNVIRIDPCVFIPSSLSQAQMVSVIFIASRVRPSLALEED